MLESLSGLFHQNGKKPFWIGTWGVLLTVCMLEARERELLSMSFFPNLRPHLDPLIRPDGV